MKKNKKFYFMVSLLLLIALVVLSCDRFDNRFQPVEEDETFYERISLFRDTLLNTLPLADIETIMEFYDDSYLNDGWTKNDVESYFTQLSSIVTDNLGITIIDDHISQLTFTYSITDEIAEIDTVIVEYTLDKNSDYLFIGNQQDIEAPEEKRVLVELFTATWCPNCPYVEAALYDLKQIYGNRFYYIEYHIMDQLAFGHSDILSYYQLPTSLPVSITQGSIQISGGSAAESYDQYNFAISQFFNQEAEFIFSDFTYSVIDEVLSFSLLIDSASQNLTNLQLRYTLLEKETNVDNAAGQPCRNVVITKGAVQMSPDMFNTLLSEELTIPNFQFTNPRLTVWLQTIEPEYNSETCLVHNVNEYEIIFP